MALHYMCVRCEDQYIDADEDELGRMSEYHGTPRNPP